MALALVTRYLPDDLPTIQLSRGHKKSFKIFALIKFIALGIHATWKLLRRISMSGKSKNPLIQYFHQHLRPYLNQGIMIRNEFNTRLSLQFYFILPNRHVIVNYGSYGTVPMSVIDHQCQLIKLTEECTDMFFRVTLRQKYEQSRNIVAKAVGCNPENMMFVENVTDGMNCVFTSMLRGYDDDDAVLMTSLAYSAVTKTAVYHTQKFGVKLITLDIEFPLYSEDDVCEAFRSVLKKNKKIKMAVFDHISSATAVMMPVKKIAEICREFGVMSVVDGAHAPGQLHLNVEDIGADVYIGNLHKWYYAPKSTAIMYVDPMYHDKIDPMLVSHLVNKPIQDRFFKQGTKNYTAHITAGYAVGNFMENIGGIAYLHSYITPLVEWVVELYKKEWGTDELETPDSMKAPYMRVVKLPTIFTKHYGATTEGGDEMILDLLRDFRITIFVNPADGQLSTRVSAQIFSTKSEYLYVARVIKAYAKSLELRYS